MLKTGADFRTIRIVKSKSHRKARRELKKTAGPRVTGGETGEIPVSKGGNR